MSDYSILGRAGRILAVVLLAVAMLVAPGGTRAWAGTDEGRRQLQAAVAELHGLGVTGVQAAVADHRRYRSARAGTADLTTGAPVSKDGYFRMGSNSKTFAAVIALQLVGEGRLRLTDPVDRWLPGLVTGNGHDGRRITVRDLLRHTSGIFNYTNDLPALESPEAFEQHRYDHYEPADLVAIAMRHPPVFPPGQGWDYSNTNYTLIGMIIERVTGESWSRQLQRRILGPLGLRETSAPGDRAQLPGPHARAYQQYVPDGPLVDVTEFNPSIAWAAGDLVTTPSDLIRFWRALQSGRLLRPAQQAQMHQTVLAETFQDFVPGARYGLGIMWLPGECGGYWGHGGDVPGTSTANGVTDRGDRAVVFALSTQLAGSPADSVLRHTLDLVDETLCAGR
nr:serine hydrolase domain-containing protein [Micromonospora sp. DSM 115978]